MVKDRFEGILPERGLATIAQALLDITADAAVRCELSGSGRLADDLMTALEAGDSSSCEQALVALYLHLHGAGSEYASMEREILKSRSGYGCHAGGLTPLLFAGPFIGPETTVADLGAGNGLQGLLLQRLSPHGRTVMIELSAEMIRIGRMFQKALGIEDGRVEWVHGDIADSSFDLIDFVYLFRPARPSEGGCELYREIGRKLAAGRNPRIVLSVADCLGPYLDGRFSILFTDGHLTCFVKSDCR